jgi:glycosyltransferase involved in cell wall biosynthesis
LQKYSDWQLIIVGDGEDLPRLKSFAKRKHIKNITFTGFVDPSDYYREAKILVLPSFSEGFGMVLLEGMTHGCVPVVFDVSPSFYDIIEDGESGFIANNKKEYINKCEFLMTHPVSLNEMSVKAKTRVDTLFSLDIITDKWVHLFNELIDG